MGIPAARPLQKPSILKLQHRKELLNTEEFSKWMVLDSNKE
jgi:hypothetical protein